MAKVLISIPDELLERVDREARERGDSRSGFLQRAAQASWAGGSRCATEKPKGGLTYRSR